jgi:hypothetical protein
MPSVVKFLFPKHSCAPSGHSKIKIPLWELARGPRLACQLPVIPVLNAEVCLISKRCNIYLLIRHCLLLYGRSQKLNSSATEKKTAFFCFHCSSIPVWQDALVHVVCCGSCRCGLFSPFVARDGGRLKAKWIVCCVCCNDDPKFRTKVTFS